ncbi:chlorophyll A-B binding family protein [Actinidia rufa]|uniref:Chlorophyll A-B binding family protein n=1 Tax=Actinidia rufa TaxID=165716 RepID=A0A7J0ECH3_9ERIC|nr:chlorophyll A-B binding family protein [Actinidia rufa]
MASFAITASMHRACSSHQVTKKQQSTHPKRTRSLGTKQPTNVLSLDVEKQKDFALLVDHDEEKQGGDGDDSVPKFLDERWKKGTWDLNMFVKDGKMDWDGVIVAEARRRKFLEVHPEVATNQEPVLFRSSIIPWWAWVMHSHLPEAELLNGRAAMVGFCMAYLLDVLTGLDVVGQTGNFICKAGLFVTIVGIILFRRKDDFENLQKLTDEATFYDKQWQASWQDHDAGSSISEQSGKNI